MDRLWCLRRFLKLRKESNSPLYCRKRTASLRTKTAGSSISSPPLPKKKIPLAFFGVRLQGWRHFVEEGKAVVESSTFLFARCQVEGRVEEEADRHSGESLVRREVASVRCRYVRRLEVSEGDAEGGCEGEEAEGFLLSEAVHAGNKDDYFDAEIGVLFWVAAPCGDGNDGGAEEEEREADGPEADVPQKEG